jgi:hypothetical protein
MSKHLVVLLVSLCLAGCVSAPEPGRARPNRALLQPENYSFDHSLRRGSSESRPRPS